MTRPLPTVLAALSLLPALPLALVWAGTAPTRAADLPFGPPSSPFQAQERLAEPGLGGGGYQVSRVPVRPRPQRYDIYGYPVLAGLPNPLAVGSGCPVAAQPAYDPDGNFAGYAPFPMCR